MNKASLQSFCKAKNIGIVQKLIPLKGGLTHETFEVLTDQNHFALKVLNPLIMQKEGALARYEETEKMAREFAKKGIPAVYALEMDGRVLHQIEDQWVLIYPWIAGVPCYGPDMNLEKIAKVAGILAKMHGCFPAPCHSRAGGNPGYAFTGGLDSRLRGNDNLIEKCQGAKAILCHDKIVLSHRDFDPKNVLWQNDEPFIIDWESVAPIHPMEELVALAFEWSGLEEGLCNSTFFKAFFRHYRDAGGAIAPKHLENGLYAFLANYVEWLDFNIERLQHSKSEKEKALAQKQIDKTLAKIEFLQNQKDKLYLLFDEFMRSLKD